MGRNNAKDIFLNYIKEKGLRYTKQREAILEAFLASGKHITIDDLYNTVKKINQEIGYATVHRNLKLMTELFYRIYLLKFDDFGGQILV